MKFFWITFKNTFAYRMASVLSVISSVLYIAINIMIWRYLFREQPEMIGYMTKYTIIANIIGMFYSNNIANRIGAKVAKGDFVMDLLKPVSILYMSWQMELAQICNRLLTEGIFTFLVFLPYLMKDNRYFNIGYVILAVVLGHILFMLIYSLVGFLTYVFIKVWPLERLVNDTIRLFAGIFIPLSLLPGFLKNVAYYLPFRFLYSFPLELLLGNSDISHIHIEYFRISIWIAVFAGANWIVYHLALRRSVIQGG
ncbi:hypothetical protein IMSAGC019_03305 [Lachnospiraceae bacterium]|nr:hypothetical protein IMSAGC019_03305 [Lachnospiraceae bacterium]